MKKISLFLLLNGLSYLAIAQHPYDKCSTPLLLQNVTNYCSSVGEYNNQNAINEDESIAGKDVWFTFIATAYDINITVNGDIGGDNNTGTLKEPTISLITTEDCKNYINIVGTTTMGQNNSISFYKGGLQIGQTYYIRIGANNNNTGTFQLCVKNYFPPIKHGQDYGNAAILCSLESFIEADVTGAGLNNEEALGSCLGDTGPTEANTAWYKWKAANNGTLVFTISPTTTTNDIDWALYDLGITDDPLAITATNVIRCAAGHGINNSQCPTEAIYYKTGLDFDETDTSEPGGCGAGQNGKVRYVDMIQGHYYALIINNFSSGSNGFTLDFKDQQGRAGTADFEGPKSAIQSTLNNPPCTAGQTFTFQSNASNYASLKWNFGEGASMSEATTAGPFTVSYTTPGTKVIVLEAISSKGCSVFSTQTLTVGFKHDAPLIYSNQPDFCLKDTIHLSTPELPFVTYRWTGPNNFSSDKREVSIPVTSTAVAGTYSLVITEGGCSSEASFINIPVLNPPIAAFRTTPELPAKLSYPVTIHFLNQSSLDADTFLWDFGDGNQSTEKSPYHIYDKEGDFIVTLTAFKSATCNATMQKGKFVTLANSALFLPNVFTPNGDGINDDFVIDLTNINNYSITIFNRWGQQLFQSTDIFDNWKGTFNGEPMPVDTYFYLIKATNLDGSPIVKSGFVSIIR